jgi:hypothetical protein
LTPAPASTVESRLLTRSAPAASERGRLAHAAPSAIALY